MQLPKNHYALIMAGGEGTRFFPLSTPEKPKQFLNLLDTDKSLLQQTYDRLADIFDAKNILVATNQRYVSLVQEQLPNLGTPQIFGETEKKNTAPCLAWVSYQLFQKDKEGLLVAIPADQFITPIQVLQEILKKAFEVASQQEAIVTIGIKPTFASTHHGYLHKAGNQVKEFVEKPDSVTAEKYFKNSNFFWNAGTFIFPVKKMLEAIQECLPEIFSLLQKETAIEEFFAKAPSISIDYGVMEKRKDLYLVEGNLSWSDVGTWESLAQLAKQHSLQLPNSVKKYLMNNQ